MAVDTRDKRASALRYQSWVYVAPNPDGSLATAADRMQMAGLYRGLTAAAPSTMTVTLNVTMDKPALALTMDR